MTIYNTKGTCSRQIVYTIKDNILTDLKFIGGCSGSLQAISKLTIGHSIDEIIPMLQGIKCRNNTSCPDQLALALIKYKEENSTT